MDISDAFLMADRCFNFASMQIIIDNGQRIVIAVLQYPYMYFSCFYILTESTFRQSRHAYRCESNKYIRT